LTSQIDAFLSYTRRDDEFFGGAITSLRKFLELGVQVVTGQKNFNIFQDIDGIEFGQQWERRLDRAVVSTIFLIPVITPLFFQSTACRDELKKFIAHEKKQKRDDLILPLYFVTAPVLEKTDSLADDSLASEINTRQRYDWRTKADLPIDDPQTRRAVIDLAEKIAAAIARTMTAPAGSRKKLVSKDKIKSNSPLAKKVKASAFKKASEKVKRQQPRKKSKDQRKILWVDDIPDNNIFERRAMESYNIEFSLAKSTSQALAKLKKAKFDAIISDMRRPPDMTAGYTLLDALRGSGNLTPFFIYAGSDSPKHLRLALSKGAQGSTNSSDTLIANIIKSLEVSGNHSPIKRKKALKRKKARMRRR
jgi:CheY-like chemotaxis protein